MESKLNRSRNEVRRRKPAKANPVVKSMDDFLQLASQIHDDKYDYSCVNFQSTQHKVTIKCKKHDHLFEQRVHNHLFAKAGCPLCGVEARTDKRRASKDSFVSAARKVYGDRYDYSKVKYLNSRSKVTIICPAHGEFEQTPSNHLSFPCKYCSKENVVNRRLDLESEAFLVKAREIHGVRYDYSNVKYRGAIKRVCIICLKHGEFWQKPHHHLNSEAHCPRCAAEQRGDDQRLTTEEFIVTAKKKHGDKYDYSKSVYVGQKEKITITCRKHGDFQQRVYVHLHHRCGCPKCSESRGETAVRRFLEDNKIKHKPQVRVGKGLGRKVFDFVIKHNGVKIIEFNGLQHYMPSSFRRKIALSKQDMIRNLVKQVSRDVAKEEWAARRGYPLLVIPFWDIKNIPTIVSMWLEGKTPTFSSPPNSVNMEYVKRIRQKLGVAN